MLFRIKIISFITAQNNLSYNVSRLIDTGVYGTYNTVHNIPNYPVAYYLPQFMHWVHFQASQLRVNNSASACLLCITNDSRTVDKKCPDSLHDT
jgi:hypothetical protein